MISETNLSKELGVSRRTVYRWRKNDYIVPIYQDEGRIFYDIDQVRRQLKSYPQLWINQPKRV